MILDVGNRALAVIVIGIFAVVFPVIFLVDWLDEEVLNPRVWDDWSCNQMLEHATSGKDEAMSDFQRAQFHEDLSRCLGS